MAECPRCLVALVEGVGALGEPVCSACSGRFLDVARGQRVLEVAGQTTAGVKEIVNALGALSTKAKRGATVGFPCPGCSHPMSQVPLRGVTVDVCVHCGGLWFDRGELARLSAGTVSELEVPARDAAAASPEPARPSSKPAPTAPATTATAAGNGWLVLVEGPVDVDVLFAAFQSAGLGLARPDAAQRAGRGVVHEGGDPGTSAALAAALMHAGVAAASIDRASLGIAAATQCSRVRREGEMLACVRGPTVHRVSPAAALGVACVKLSESSRTTDVNVLTGGKSTTVSASTTFVLDVIFPDLRLRVDALDVGDDAFNALAHAVGHARWTPQARELFQGKQTRSSSMIDLERQVWWLAWMIKHRDLVA